MSLASRNPSLSPLSSLLSMASTTPEPPFGYGPPTPSDTQTEMTSPSKSRDSSLSPDGPSSYNLGREEGDGPPPAKRRKINIPKPRTTETLDLNYLGEWREGCDLDNEEVQLRRLTHALRNKKKIVVIAGAGISVGAGIPDFRSSNGLFKQLKSQDKMKTSGKALFDAAVYRSNDSTESFHTMVREMSRLTKDAKPTAFHHMLASLAKEGRLLRLYTQNIDGIETAMGPLKTTVPLPSKGPWPKTIQLHGGLDQMVCTLCNKLEKFDGELFDGPEAPTCKDCESLDDVRQTFGGKRSRGVGRLRPRIVLYNEGNPDDEAIGACAAADLKSRPDAVIVAGTSLKIPGLKRIVKEMCAVTRDRKLGFTAWVNRGPESIATEFKGTFDLLVQGDCEDVAHLVGLPEWNVVEADPPRTYTKEEVAREKKLAHLRVIVNATAPASKQNQKQEEILTPQSDRFQSPAPARGRPKRKQTKLEFGAESKAVTTKAVTTKAVTTKAATKAKKPTAKTTEAAKAPPKRKPGRPPKSAASTVQALQSFAVTKRAASTTAKQGAKIPTTLDLDRAEPLPSRRKRESPSSEQHDPMQPISPVAIQNNTKVPEVRDSEGDSSFLSTIYGSADELADGGDKASKKTGTNRSPLQSFRASMGKTVSPKGGLPRGLEHCFD